MSMEEIIVTEYQKRVKSLVDTVERKQKELKETETRLEDLKKLEERRSFFVEGDYVGVRASLHKKGEEVKLFFDENVDATILFQSPDEFDSDVEEMEKFDKEVLAQATELSKKDFILDCEAVKHKNTVLLYVLDLLYLDGDVTEQPLSRRKNLLKTLKFSGRIRESPFVLVKVPSDLREAIKLYNKLDNCNGVLVRKYMGKYFDSDGWVRYGRIDTVRQNGTNS